MTLKKNLQFSFFAYLLGMPIFFLLSLFWYVKTNSLNTLMIGFLFCYIFTVLHTMQYYGVLSLYAIYLYTSAFFIYDCFVFTLFGNKNFLIQYFPYHFQIEESTGAIFIISCFITVFVTHCTYCLIPKHKLIKKEREIPINNNACLEKFGKVLMFLFLIPVLYKIWIQLTFIRFHGYTSIFDGSMSKIHYPFWTAGSFIFFIGGYVILFASMPNKRTFIIFSLLFLFVYGFNSLKGQRGPIISAILVVLFLLNKQYGVKIRFKQLFIILISLIAIIIVLNNVRTGYGSEIKEKSSIPVSEMISEIVYGQTTSRAVPLIIMDRKLDFHPYPFVYSPLLIPYYGVVYPSNGQDKTSAEHHNNISQVIMYNLSPSTHLNGGGLGGAFLGEAYDCGGFLGVIFWSIVIAFIFVVFDYGLGFIHLKFRPFLFFYLLSIPTLSRGRIFGFIYDLNKIFFVYIVLLLVSMRDYIKLRNYK